MLIHMIIWDFTMTKGRGGAGRHIQAIIYVNTAEEEKFISDRSRGSKTTTTAGRQ